MVEGDRPRRRAISRIDRRAHNPREISSRSVILSAKRDRQRTRGAIPPFFRTAARRVLSLLPMALAIVATVSPPFQRRHSSAFSRAVIQRPMLMCNPPRRYVIRIVLHRPLESTPEFSAKRPLPD